MAEELPEVDGSSILSNTKKLWIPPTPGPLFPKGFRRLNKITVVVTERPINTGALEQVAEYFAAPSVPYMCKGPVQREDLDAAPKNGLIDRGFPELGQ